MVMSREIDRVKGYVEREVPKLMKSFKVPGFSISIVDRSGILYCEGFGYRDLVVEPKP